MLQRFITVKNKFLFMHRRLFQSGGGLLLVCGCSPDDEEAEGRMKTDLPLSRKKIF